ncbi:MAG: hypothetical protein VX723_04715, partial [Candidatus Thermoplasmatota archaeon]|nr:hypothetical protein [Candidatus Thermoplasmatota archaeon]
MRSFVENQNDSFYSGDLKSEDMLNRAMVPGWTKAIKLEFHVPKFPYFGSSGSSHKHQLMGEIESSQPDLMHITEQELAHLVPEDCRVPVVVTVNHWFDLEPRRIKAGDVRVPVGDQ